MSCSAREIKGDEESFFGEEAESLQSAGLIRHCEDCAMFHIVYGWNEIEQWRSDARQH